MKVQKRRGQLEPVSFDKVLARISALSGGLSVDVYEVAQKVCGRIYDGVKTSELDELAAQMCSSLIVLHPDYSTLASRIIVSNHHKNTSPSFAEAMRELRAMGLITEAVSGVVEANAARLDAEMDYDRDYAFDYFGFKTLEHGYLMKEAGGSRTVERPQHMFLRVALGIHGADVDAAVETYQLMSKRCYTHATPTLFNAGTPRPALSSCFLVQVQSDSIEGIYDTLKDCACISKHSGGIGLHVHNVRARGSLIRGTNGQSTGILPMLRVFNATARYVNQCFAPDTTVYTDRGPLGIADVAVGDRVVTLDGTLKEVTRVHVRVAGPEDVVVKVGTSWSGTPVTVTADHQVLACDWGSVDYVGVRDLVPNVHRTCVPTKLVLDGDDQARSLDLAPDSARELGAALLEGRELDVPAGELMMRLSAESVARLWGGAGVTELRAGAQTHVPLIKALLALKLGRKVVEHQPGHLRVSDGGSDTAPGFWYSVTEVTPVEYGGTLHDLTVDGNHTYLTDMGIVHNSGKRNGSCAIFLEPWHYDVEGFLDLRKNHGHEEERARDLFLAMWIPDLFMRRVAANASWSLMCPDSCPGLSDVHGAEFDKLYERYEAEGKFAKQIKAQDLWLKILESQIETGVPYMGYKDHANAKTNQSNVGVIKSSNLCMEICEVSTPDEIAVCNLASVCLPTFVAPDRTGFDFEALHGVVRTIARNLNRVIDVNYYPVEKARRSNMRHRPIGIGVQGLADAFILLRMPFESDRARELNRLIFETMYHAALTASADEAVARGAPYETFPGSPASRGVLQFDMWGVEPTPGRYDWEALKARVRGVGLANSLLIAPMPTASTSQIMGFNECVEPFTSNVYKRKTLAGEFILVNKYLVADLVALGLWSEAMRDRIVAAEGSVQHITEIPQELKDLYKTVWEIKQRSLIDMAADRGAYVCQSQSMNLFLESPEVAQLSSMHFYAWKKGLKTGMYYLRSKPKAKTQKFTLDPRLSKGNIAAAGPVCTMEEGCQMCSS